MQQNRALIVRNRRSDRMLSAIAGERRLPYEPWAQGPSGQVSARLFHFRWTARLQNTPIR